MLLMICNIWYNVLVHSYEICRLSSETAPDHKPRSLWMENQKSVNQLYP